ncbi:hypothetical protein M0R45_020408 [Rubus argutus]|uniref:Uncharacterized protein n=1 Tax=Rubus argutus TaxID=59490 RepID=A0AAW1X9X7_RUBAR
MAASVGHKHLAALGRSPSLIRSLSDDLSFSLVRWSLDLQQGWDTQIRLMLILGERDLVFGLYQCGCDGGKASSSFRGATPSAGCWRWMAWGSE